LISAAADAMCGTSAVIRDRSCSSVARRVRIVLLVLAGCIAGRGASALGAAPTSAPSGPPERIVVATTSVGETPALRAPAGPDEGDLDLHRHWRAAHVRQVLWPGGRRWGFRQHSDLVVRGGRAHRALLLLPSSDGLPSRASFKVDLPVESACELVAWVALEATVGTASDGVDFGVAALPAERDPDTAPVAVARLRPGPGRSKWREVRLDLAPYAGRTIWVVLAAREAGDAAGDWLLWGDPRVRAKDAGDTILDLGRSGAGAASAPPLLWSEVNLFKPYSVFRDRGISPASPRWIARAFPWLASFRLFSALGANWGPSLAGDDRAEAGANPTFDGSRRSRARTSSSTTVPPRAGARCAAASTGRPSTGRSTRSPTPASRCT
jgi:hypothetical protein